MRTTQFWVETDDGDEIRRAEGGTLHKKGVNISERNCGKGMVGGFKMEGYSKDCNT